MKKITLAFLMLFSSLVAVAQCDFQLELNDSFGDGWNGNSIDVIVNGTIVLDDATLGAGSQGFETFTVSDGDEITFTVDDSGSFDNEVSYRILNNIGQEVGAGNLTMVPDAITANCIDCELGSAMVEVFADCANDEFSFLVNVTSLGDSGSYTVSTNYDSQTQTITETGPTLIGPYTVTPTNIIVTLTPDDVDCILTFDRPIPCPPANDMCMNAEGLGDGDTEFVNTNNATGDPDGDGCGISTAAQGVWYFVNDQGTPIDVTIDTNGSDFDTELSVFTGPCDALVCLDNDDDGGDGLQSSITFTTDGSGENYYILATGFGSNTGNLQVNASGAGLLSTDSASNELAGFTMFPNPVRESLTISNNATIQNVQVYNLLGQKVLDQNLGTTTDQLNVSTLKSGAYLIQVTSEGQTGTYKFIKQ